MASALDSCVQSSTRTVPSTTSQVDGKMDHWEGLPGIVTRLTSPYECSTDNTWPAAAGVNRKSPLPTPRVCLNKYAAASVVKLLGKTPAPNHTRTDQS